jgi:hypothetical protein
MEPTHEEPAVDTLELDRQAWNLPRPVKRPPTSAPSFSVQSEREDKTEAATEAA